MPKAVTSMTIDVDLFALLKRRAQETQRSITSLTEEAISALLGVPLPRQIVRNTPAELRLLEAFAAAGDPMVKSWDLIRLAGLPRKSGERTLEWLVTSKRLVRLGAFRGAIWYSKHSPEVLLQTMLNAWDAGKVNLGRLEEFTRDLLCYTTHESPAVAAKLRWQYAQHTKEDAPEILSDEVEP